VAKRKKKQILCAQTGMPCEWYKKGRKHRVLVRSDGVIIANNPIPLLGLLGSAVAKKAVVTGALTAGAGFLTGKILNRKKGDKDEEGEGSPSSVTYDSRDVPNPGTDAWYIEKVSRGEI